MVFATLAHTQRSHFNTQAHLCTSQLLLPHMFYAQHSLYSYIAVWTTAAVASRASTCYRRNVLEPVHNAAHIAGFVTITVVAIAVHELDHIAKRGKPVTRDSEQTRRNSCHSSSLRPTRDNPQLSIRSDQAALLACKAKCFCISFATAEGVGAMTAKIADTFEPQLLVVIAPIFQAVYAYCGDMSRLWEQCQHSRHEQKRTDMSKHEQTSHMSRHKRARADTSRHKRRRADTSRHEQTLADTSRHKQARADTNETSRREQTHALTRPTGNEKQRAATTR